MNVEPGVGKWVSYLNRERKLDSIVGSRPILVHLLIYLQHSLVKMKPLSMSDHPIGGAIKHIHQHSLAYMKKHQTRGFLSLATRQRWKQQ